MIKTGPAIAATLTIYATAGCTTGNVEVNEPNRIEGNPAMGPVTIEVCDEIIRNPGKDKPFSERPKCIRSDKGLYLGLVTLLKRNQFELRDGRYEIVVYELDHLQKKAAELPAYQIALVKADLDQDGVIESGEEAETLVALLSKMKPVGEETTEGAHEAGDLQFGRAIRMR